MIVGWQLAVMLEFLLIVRWSLLRVGMGMVREREGKKGGEVRLVMRTDIKMKYYIYICLISYKYF